MNKGIVVPMLLLVVAATQAAPTIFDAVLGEAGQPTAEVSTEELRYQFGIPVWRALGGVTQIEPERLRSVLANDRTAVVIDVREPQERQASAFPNAQPIPRSAVLEGKDVGLPQCQLLRRII